MSLEEALKENTAALLRVAANQEKLIAGQQAAIDKIDAGKGAGKPAAAAPKADKPAAAAKETAAPKVKTVSDDDVKAAAVAWMGAVTKGKSEADTKTIKGECAVFLGAILNQFGVGGKLTGPESKLDADQRKQAKFYIERKAAGQSVDFGAEYDFDGDVKQGAAAPAAAEAEEEDPLG